MGRLERGDSHKNWKPDLEWLLKSSNFLKVIEGKYDGSGKSAESDLDDFIARAK